jgi:aldehyde dehydrogenase (NAD+)
MQYNGVRFNMTIDTVEYKSFGTTPARCPPPLSEQTANGPVPLNDRTYKLYYGGAYKRPDGNSSRVVLSGTGKLLATVADGSRWVFNSHNKSF